MDDSIPLTYKQFQKNPESLTKFAAPSSELSFSDGLAGNMLPGGVLVTTPNVDYLYAPPLREIQVRLRRENHFGSHDPLYFPQPYSERVAHLALLARPRMQPDAELFYLWKRALPRHFVPAPDSSSLKGVGTLDRAFHDNLLVVCRGILDKVPNSTEDVVIAELTAQLRVALDRLRYSSPQEDLLLRVAWTQRLALELDARVRWISKEWEVRFKSASLRQKVHPVADVIGAFSEDPAVVDLLFHAGIPVFFVRESSQWPNVRVDKLAPFIQEDAFHQFTTREGAVIDCRDSIPPRREVFRGLTGKLERYLAMGLYLRKRLQYPSMLGSLELSSHATSSRVSITSQTRSGSGRLKPYARKPRIPVDRKGGRNPFEEFTHPYMPQPVATWQTALTYLAGYHSSKQTNQAVNFGYMVPPPRCLLSAEDDGKKGVLFIGWLKLREMVLFQLTNALCRPLRWSLKKWRTALFMVGNSVLSENANTVAANARRVLREELEKTLKEAAVELNLANLLDSQAMWKGVPVHGLPSPEIASEILWELSEINFRNDLLALDKHLDTSGMNLMDRQDMIDDCWGGTMSHVDLSAILVGLGARDTSLRLYHLQAMYKLMQSWRPDKPEALLEDFPSKSDAHNFPASVQRVETALAEFFTECFLDIFGRAASIPHHR